MHNRYTCTLDILDRCEHARAQFCGCNTAPMMPRTRRCPASTAITAGLARLISLPSEHTSTRTPRFRSQVVSAGVVARRSRSAMGRCRHHGRARPSSCFKRSAFPPRLAAPTTAEPSLAAPRAHASLPPRGPAKPHEGGEVGTTTPLAHSSFPSSNTKPGHWHCTDQLRCQARAACRRRDEAPRQAGQQIASDSEL